MQVLNQTFPELSNREIEALAWSGLQDTKAFKHKIDKTENFLVDFLNTLGTIELNYSEPGYESICNN